MCAITWVWGRAGAALERQAAKGGGEGTWEEAAQLVQSLGPGIRDTGALGQTTELGVLTRVCSQPVNG